MASQITIKRSPIVLIRTLIIIEALAFVAYLGVAQLGNYKYEIYTKFQFLSQILSYQTAKFLLLSGAQLAITVYAFLRWYYESYIVLPGAISHKWGVFFKKETTIPLQKSMTLTLSSSPLGKRLHYGSIHIDNGAPHNSLTLGDIQRPHEQRRTIERFAEPQSKYLSEEPNVLKLILEEEHEHLEFKSTLRFDERQKGISREMEKAVMKTVAAFLNSKGGILVIGINDGQELIGLKNDYETLTRKDSDGFENHFTQIFNKMIGPEFRHLVRLRFQEVNGNDVCLVQVASSARPIYLKIDSDEHFYVRTGNVTTPLKLSEVDAYSRSRWPRRVNVS